MGDDDAAGLARLRAEVGQLTRERDALIAACIAETWQQRLRTLAEAEDDDRWECNWVWRISGMGDTVGTRDEAVAAVRRAAGLGAEGEGGLSDDLV
jgi:hypothetical protein